MQEKNTALRPLAYAAIATNGLLLLFLAWHLAIEAIPAAVKNFSETPTLEGRTFALIVLLPYVLALGYLARKPRTRILEWRTAAALLASMAAYIGLVLAIGFHIVSQSMPA